GMEMLAETVLLGAHNVQNILLAVSICFYLGLTEEQVERGIQKLKAVEHRLQLLPNDNGVTVIDDAFNSNPQGTKAALTVLNQFAGRKIIITPGMVEMGSQEEKYNKAFGEHMAQVVDIAILIGEKRSKPMVEGLLTGGFPKEKIFIVNSLDESTAQLNRIIQRGDIILYENDLPDHYNER
ncbi:MAG: UDP-N-acetylmuramoyl-tripeptide--D-alanyl-D-alanine ligase, partial [Clostridiales bacterium]|nr:UDP-N-acetylmuramoyl-tripeptide--D-alanyl-D-alanine ligase [Clostridiales bacterium]